MPDSDASSSTLPCRSWRPFLAVMLIALVVRGGALWAMRDKLKEDPDAYRQVAEGLLKSGTYTLDVPLGSLETPMDVEPTAYRPPLYPILLTKIASGIQVPPIRVAAVHWLLGLFTVALTWRLSREWLGEERCWVAPLLVAVDPILLFQSGQVMTETLAAFLTVVCLWQAGRFSTVPNWWNSALLGAAIGLASLCRPTYLPWLAAGLLIAASLRGCWKERVLRVAPLLLAFAVIMSPWVARNYICFHRPIMATTHGGYTLWLANNPSFYKYLKSDRTDAWQVNEVDDALIAIEIYKTWWDTPALFDPDSTESFELRRDSVYKAEALNFIRENPGMFAWSCLVRIYYLWSPLPQKTSLSESTYRTLARCAVAAWYLAVYALASAGMWKLRQRLLAPPWIWGLTLCLVFTAVHAVYWSNLRMRAPLMPVVALLAAAGVSKMRAQNMSAVLAACNPD